MIIAMVTDKQALKSSFEFYKTIIVINYFIDETKVSNQSIYSLSGLEFSS